ncbi:homeobox protein cut-like 1 [Delphinapterus leucas]|uniref:Homeobox protein cut-like 1 n=1 Tax=Delphinapterus leucas TaxID=9749 RepID=A0A2Y9P138_DELLE|nr:homeobox protein cut-like 1 [Delphinapterus leucas]
MSALSRAGPARSARSTGRGGERAREREGRVEAQRPAQTEARTSRAAARRPEGRSAPGALFSGLAGETCCLTRGAGDEERRRGRRSRLPWAPLPGSGGRGGSGGCAAAAAFGSSAPRRAAAALCSRRALRREPRHRLLPGGRRYRRHPPAPTAARGCLGVVGAATRGIGDGQVAGPALSCRARAPSPAQGLRRLEGPSPSERQPEGGPSCRTWPSDAGPDRGSTSAFSSRGWEWLGPVSRVI